MMPRKMKDSGVEWLGAVPEGWVFYPIKRFFSFFKGLNITKADLTESGIPVVSYGQIHAKNNTGTHLQDELLRHVPQQYLESCPEARLKENDFVFADTSEDLEGLGNCVFVDRSDAVMAGYHTIVLRPVKNAHFKYLAYLFRADCWRRQMREIAFGIKVYSLSQRMLRQCSLVLPPLPEQRAIAAYLDQRCAKIDAMVADAKKLIEEYKAWKSSLIFEAVTGKVGVDGRCRCRKMRDSGVEWVGAVPEGWKVCRLKDVASIHTGSTPDRSMQEYFSRDSGLPWIKAENLGTECPIESATEYLTEAGIAVGRKFPSKTVYVCCIASVGKVGFAEIEASCNQQINALLFKSGYDYKFGFYSMVAAEDEYNVRASGNVVKILNSTLQGMIKIPYPPLPEQQAIAAYLDKKCAAIDRVVAEKEGLIADLEQYKKSLIFECVTGKREVA